MEAGHRDRRRERIVRVAIAENAFTAEMLRAQLQEAGIRSLVRNRDAGSVVIGGIGGASYSLELLVLEGDADLAAAVLGAGPQQEALPPPRLSATERRARRRRWWR